MERLVAVALGRFGLRRSLIWGGGLEMVQHALLRLRAGLLVYLCEPRSRWRGGTKVNTNGLLGQEFPHGADVCGRGAEELAAVAVMPNSGPRKTPGALRAAAEALNEYLTAIV